MVEPLKPVPRAVPPRTGRTPVKPRSVAAQAAAVAPQGDRLSLAGGTARATHRARPTPIAPEGRLDYYQLRHHDFLARYPDGEPPSYYLDYGDVYVRRFTEVLSPELSEAGQAWLVQARKNLQVSIEDELARNPEIERDDAAFTTFAYATHSQAYLDAGLTELPLDDLLRIVVTPALEDTLNPTGLAVIQETAEAVAREKLAKAMHAPGAMAQEVLDAVKRSPDLIRDVAKLLATEENADFAVRLMDRLWMRMSERMETLLERFRAVRVREPAAA